MLDVTRTNWQYGVLFKLNNMPLNLSLMEVPRGWPWVEDTFGHIRSRKVYLIETFWDLLYCTLKHLRGLLKNPFRKTDDGIDYQKSDDPEQQHGQYKKAKTVFYKIGRFQDPLIRIG